MSNFCVSEKMNVFNPIDCYRSTIISVSMQTRVVFCIFDPQNLLTPAPLTDTSKLFIYFMTHVFRLHFELFDSYFYIFWLLFSDPDHCFSAVNLNHLFHSIATEIFKGREPWQVWYYLAYFVWKTDVVFPSLTNIFRLKKLICFWTTIKWRKFGTLCMLMDSYPRPVFKIIILVKCAGAIEELISITSTIASSKLILLDLIWLIQPNWCAWKTKLDTTVNGNDQAQILLLLQNAVGKNYQFKRCKQSTLLNKLPKNENWLL